MTKCGIRLVSENRPEHRLKTYDTSKDHIVNSVDTSLRNLHTDYLDVLPCTGPIRMNADEVAGACGQLKEAGKVKHSGVSTFTTHQFAPLQSRPIFRW